VFTFSTLFGLGSDISVLGILRGRKFVILHPTCPQRISASGENAGSDRLGSELLSSIFSAFKILTLLQVMLRLIAFCFLITSHRSRFPISIPL
jgi:hypothetical protein